MRERNPEVVGELVHKYPVALDNRRLHRPGWDHIPVGQGAAENYHQDNEEAKSPVFAPRLEKTRLHTQSPVIASTMSLPGTYPKRVAAIES